MTTVVLRFVTHSTHQPFGFRSGLFKTAYEIRRSVSLEAPRFAEMDEQLSWFEKNLAIPTRFSTSRHPRAKKTAISWIKSDAKEHVRRLRLLVALVEDLGDVSIEEIRTERPGYVVFEDAHQIIALPFTNTPR